MAWQSGNDAEMSIREIPDEDPTATTWKVPCDSCHVLGSPVRARTLSIGNVEFMLCGKCWGCVHAVTAPRSRWGQSGVVRAWRTT